MTLTNPRSPAAAAQGFTLIELAIVATIIGLILVVVLQGQSLIDTSQSQAVQIAVKDLATAMSQFRDRYGYLPGDIPNATTQVPGVVAGSCSVTANGNGDGQIDAAEIPCVNTHLFQAGLIKGGAAATTIIASGGKIITIRTAARTASPVSSFPSSTRNVIEIWNVPCQIAQDLDAKTDDGNFATGNTRATVASCVVGGANDPVATMAVAL